MIWIWTGFIVLVLLMLTLDLGVFHRKAHVVKDELQQGPGLHSRTRLLPITARAEQMRAS